MEIRNHVLLIILLLSSPTVTQSNIDQSKLPDFLFPGKAQSNEIYHTQDTLIVKYVSFFEPAELFTFCEHGVGRFITKQKVPGFNATVPVKLNFTSPDPCWLNLRTGPGGLYGMNTYLFNVLAEQRPEGSRTFRIEDSVSASTSRTTVSTMSSTDGIKTTMTTMTTTSSISETGTVDPRPSTADSESISLHPIALVAIGFGISIVLIALIAVGYVLRRRRQKAQIGKQPGESHEPCDKEITSRPQWQYGGELDSVKSPVEAHSVATPVEMPNRWPAVELDEGRKRHEIG
ncbi:hypothetical protein QBC44DRAFT_372151 [Cladorrhinum sp. PSN332]|nr:hypothetical protein QBC44DRAFT_372151 [Cladorrhinum sp. PSN332]